LVHENEPLVEIHLKSTDHRRWPELLTIFLDLVDFVSNVVLTSADKEDLVALVQLLIDDFSSLEKSNLQVLHDESHELRVLVITES
jgi:hypothetical protein